MSARQSTPDATFVRLIVPVATELLGKPNEALSGDAEVRWGSRGSFVVDTAKGVWVDHEAGDQGGGVLDLLQVRLSLDKENALDWLRAHKHLPADDKPRIVARYDYTDAAGQLLYQVVRFDPKDFRQRGPDGNGGWIWKMTGVQRVLYRLPKVIAANKARETIYVVEGEKAVHALEERGFTATCSPGGAGKWRAEYSDALAGASVIVLPDCDEPGEAHARQVMRSLRGKAWRARQIGLPSLQAKGDVFDYFAAGNSVADFNECIAEFVGLDVDWRGAVHPDERRQETDEDGPAGDQRPADDKPAATNSDDHGDHLADRQAYHTLRASLAKNSQGAVLATHANLALILKQDPLLKEIAAFNAFSGRHLLRKAVPVVDRCMAPSPGPYPRPWDDDDVTRLLGYVQKEWAPRFSRSTVTDCLLVEGRDHEVHDVRDYLAGLVWDGAPRIEEWLTWTFGCDLDAYHRAVGSKLLIAAVRRVRAPGCKFDQMPVLEGAQGIGKSRAIGILFGQSWSTDHVSDLGKKDAAIDLCGKWAAELPEIEQLIRADVETAKAFLSRAVDHYRPLYGRVAIDVPRQCVLIGTTNAGDYLRDSTGNRRFWPVKCRSVGASDLGWLQANRDQLWAEAAHREAAGATIWLDDAAVLVSATAAQNERLAEDPWADKVRVFTENLDKVTVPEILDKALFVPTKDQTKAMQMRVGIVLTAQGWERHAWWDAAAGKTVRGWRPKG